MTEQEKQDEQEPRLQVDEDWKKSVAEERARAREQEEARKRARPAEQKETRRFPEPSIQVFMAGLYTQTLVALGELENPLTGTKEKNAVEAEYLIDTIALLKDKTEGNLSPEESAYVQNILTNLRMRYVSATGQSGGQNEPQGEGSTAQG